ncbi:Ig-like domain-containing protein [Azospirillum argentinense]|uniref:Ig-like domain-containing protein n=1 Tax=Azospirillum argentinense TaxID=2970906 RepID=UPI001586CDA1|nr:Ig-like domain-containing protein [Azospirillum argentinense]
MLHSTVSRPVPAILGCEGAPEASRREVAFIDMALDDWQSLKAEMPAGIEVFLIDSRADGMAAMARTLDARCDIHAVHVLSHGFEGGLQLGSGRFDTRALAQRVEELASIASSLAPEGDILLYGCNVASGQGADFLTALAEATGANVAASRTPTGAADRGGDWDLDWVHGAVTTDSLRFDSYCGVMAAPTIVSGVAYVGENTIVLTFDQALDAASQPTLSYFAADMLTPGSVEINGVPTNLTAAVVSGNTLTLTLPQETFTNNDTLTIRYEDPFGDQSGGVLQGSSSGEDVATFRYDVTVATARPSTAPTLTATGGITAFSGVLDLFSSVTASTNDIGQNFTSLTLTVTGVLDGSAEMLTFYVPGMLPLDVELYDGFSMTATAMTGSPPTGSVTVNNGTATVTLTGLTLSDVQMAMLIDDITYTNVSVNLSGGERVITVTGVTDDGSSNNTASIANVSSTVIIASVPTLTATGETPTFTQGDASGVDLFSGVTASTNDLGQLFTGMVLTITNVTDDEALAGIGTNPISLASSTPFIVPGITGSGSGVIASVTKTGTTVTVTLTGLNHTDAQLGALIDGLTYINSSSTVTAGSRVITVTSVTDNAGYNNTASLTGVSATVNVSAAAATPILQSAAVTGDSLVLTYDVALDSANPPAPGAFTVTVGGTPVTVSGVAVDGANKTVTLTLGQVVAYGDTVAVSYTDPTAGDDANAIQAGTGGSDAASFTGQSVTNNSPDPSTTPPSVTAIDAYVGENVIIVTFDQALDAQSPLQLSSFGAVDSYIPLDLGTDAILVGSTKVDLRSAVISGNKLILTTVSPLAQGDYVRFTYTDPTAGNDTANVLQNLSGLDLPDTRFATMVMTTRAVNAPSLTATGNATTFTNSSSPADLFSSVTANANDLGQVFTGLTFTVTGVLDGASEYLIFMVPGAMAAIMNLADGASLMNGPFGVTGGATLNGSTLTVTISGLRLSADEMQSLLDGFYYNNVAGTPSDGQRIITLSSVTDSGVSDNIGTLTGISAVINIGAPSAPVLQSAAVNGTSLVLTYDTALDAVNIPSAGSFTVLAGGSPVTVGGVAVDTATKTVTLTLAQPVAHGAAVSVSYADPTAGDDANAIQSFGGGLDAAGFTGQSATNTTPDPNGVPPTLTLTTKNGGFSSGQGSSGTDLFDGVTASTVDNGQTFTGMVLTVHNVGGTGSTEFLSIGGTDIALSNGTSGSFASGAYTVTLANGVATVTLSGMALSNGGMDTLIDGIAYKNTDTASTNYGGSETRSIVLRSITDSGASSNSTVIDKVATVTIANTGTYTPFLTVVPTNPTIAFTPGTPQQVSFTVTATQARTLIGSSITFGVDAPSGWSVGSVSLTPTIAAIISQGDVFTLTFDVTSSGADTSGAFPISVHAISTGIDLTNSVVSSSVMVTVTPPPVFQSASVDGATLVLTYDSALDAANPPAAGAFTVKVGGTTVTVSNVAVDSTNKTVTLTLAQPVTDTDTVTVAYTDPTVGDDANAIQSPTGGDAASFTAQPVTNNTPDTTPPTLTSARLNGTQLTLTYSETLNGAQAPTSAFTVTVGGVTRTVTAVATSGRTVTLTLDTGATPYQSVTVDYTPPGSGAKTEDAVGNAAGPLSGRIVKVVGDPTFTLEGTNPFGLGDVGDNATPIFVDIDGDGDLDALVGNFASKIVFYRNIGTATQPTFTLEGSNPFGLNTVGSGGAQPTFADLDGDGDLDALVGTAGGNTYFYRNIGTVTQPTFTLEGSNPFGLSRAGFGSSVELADIDGDGDLDALIGVDDGHTVFYRNVGTATQPTFTLEATNPFGLGNVGFSATPKLLDIDGDGDLDALIGNGDGQTFFYRNVGTAAAPTFVLEGTNPFGLGDVGDNATPIFVDIDGDGDLDALIGNTDGDTVLFRNGPPPPAAPSGLALTAGSNSGSTTDTLTKVTTPTITGTAEAFATVVLYDGATAVGTATANGAGLWTVTSASLSDGAHSLTVKASTANGTSAASTALSVTIDTAAPSLTSAVLSGTRLTLTYSEALDGAETPVAGAFTVTVGGVVRTVTAVAVSGRMVTLTLDAGASSLYEGATVSYTPPGSGAKTVDAAGNAAGALNGQPVRVGGDPKFTLEGTNPFGIGSFVGQSAPVFADIDGDGDLDAVVGDWYANIVVYRNVGTAEAPSFTLVGTNPFGLNTVGGGMPAFAKPVLADIDGDGDLDLLAGNAGGGIVVYRNVGTATTPSFTLVGTNPFGFSLSTGFAAPSLADIDGDGDLDALIGDTYGDTFFYRNIGTATAPTFALESTNPFGLGNAGNNATPIFVDIDGDGDLDALIGNMDGDTVLYRNVGTATAPSFTLEATNPFSLGNVADNAKPTFADIDGDGDLDALIGRADGKTVLFRNTAPPPATPTAPTLTAGSNSGSTSDTLTNVTAPAIVGTAVASSTVVLYDGATAIGTVTADASSGLWTLSTASLSDGTHSLTVTSSNANGTSSASAALTLTIDTKAPTLTSATLNGTQLTLTYSELLDGAQTPAGAFTVMVGGVARTVTAVATSGKTVTLTLDAGATVYQSVTVDYTPPGSGAKTADAAGNAAGALTGQAVRVAGDPSFVLEATNPFGLNGLFPQAKPVFVDIDGDGDLDVLVGNIGINLQFYRNVGSATAPSFTLDAATAPFGLSGTTMSTPAFADLDGDGDLDVLVGSNSGSLLFLRNVGTATAPSFTLEATNPFGLSTFIPLASPSIADLDGDGDLDILVGSQGGDTLFYRNVGTATAPSFTLVGTNPFGLGNSGGQASPTMVDIDGDGDLDILVGNIIGDTVVYRNVGTATAPSFTLVGTNPFGLSNAGMMGAPSIVDIDGDGDLDALVGAFTSITLFRNVPPTPASLALTTASNSGSTTDTLTNVTAPAITGLAKAFTTVVLYEGATALGTVTADANGLWTVTTASLGDGAHSLTAVSSDATGTSSASSTLTVTIDSAAPNAPTVTTALSNSATPTLTGAAETGSTVTVTVGGATYTTTATNGTWSLNLATATPTSGSLSLNANGTNAVSATATDAAGNVSSAGTQTLTIDTTAPNAPAVTSAALTKNATPTLTGTAETGSTVTVTVGGATYTTTATNGSWSVNLATATPTSGSLSLNANGTNAVSATATDAAGNVSTAGTQTLTIDTTLPDAPTVTSAALTKNATPILTGTAEANATVTVTVGGATYTTTASGTGAWSVNLATATPTSGSLSLNANGTNAVSATATDAAGNTSTAGTQTLTIDTTAPNAPTVTTALSNSTTPILTGAAETGSTVTVTIGGAAYTTTATNGSWSLNLATATPTSGSLSLNANGTNAVSATATDAAGNVSTAGTQTLTIDTTLPDAPTVTSAALSNSTTPTLTGTAEANATVTVTVGGATYTTTASGTGAWSVNLATATPASGSLSLNANGTNAVSATATDAAGNTSTAGTQTLTIDTTAPNVPTVTTALSNSTTPTLTGAAETGSTVTVTIGGATYTTTATNGSWSLNLATATPTAGTLRLNANGSNPVSATATDAAGNTSTAGTQTLTIDTTLPDAPTVTSAALSNSTTPTLTGTAEANATVTVTVGGATYTTTASGTGAWSVNLATATPTSGSLSLNPNGTNAVSATATDASGNVSAPGTQTLTVDTTAPTAPTVSTALSNSTTPTLTGAAETGSTVTVTVGGATYTTTATNGSWSLNLATATPTSGSLSLNANGSNPVSATATDAAGNTSAPGTQSLTIDTTAPNAPTVTSATLTNSATPTLTGTAETGSTVTVTIGGATYTTTATNGSWSLNLATATPTSGTLSLNANGTNAVSATATDAAGNTSTAGTQTLTIDTTLPDAPTVTSAALSNSTTPTLTGTAEAGSTVTVTIGGATYTTTATNGTWSLNLATATPTAGSLSLNPNGTNPVAATATDASGNVSAPGTQTLTIDTTLPDAPTVTTALTNSTTPTLTGTAEANATVTVTVGGATYTTTASGTGAWSLDLATATPTAGSLSLDPNGANPVAATATDAAGNVSSPATHTLTVDTTPPTASVLFDDDSIDAIEQSSTAFTISGGEAGAAFTWTITSAGGGQVSGSGVMSGPTAQVGGLDLSGLGDGTLTLTLALTDPAGNASVPFTATTQKLTATVDKPAPVAPPPVATVDGATVTGAVTTNGDGSRTTTVTIEASTGTRVEDTSTANPDLADVPVVREQVVDRQTGQVSTQTTLTVSVSTGVAVTATGAAERQTAAQALTGLTGLIAAIEARTDEGTASRGTLTGGGSGFLSVLSAQAQLLVRAIDFTAPGVAAGQAVQTKVTGTTLGGTGPTSTAPTAVVLNTTGLSGPVTIQLDNVEFAAVVGNATLVGGDGEQIVYGDDHEQYMHLGEGDDLLHGGGGNDTITSAGGNDTLYGDEGDDLVYGGEGDDWLFGGSGNDLIGGGTGDDRGFGGEGDDVLFGEEGDDTLTGNEGNDTLSGGAGNDLLFGEAGDDLLYGDEGDDTLSGGAGNDTALGGSGNDLIALGSGNDLGLGGDGNDTLFGEEGDDTLFGGAGDDVLHGGAGNDVLFADGGADTLWGGEGADVFAFGRNSGGSVVMDFEVGVDRLAFYEAGIELGAVIRSARVEGGNTTLDVGGGNRITILGQTGNVAAWFG